MNRYISIIGILILNCTNLYSQQEWFIQIAPSNLGLNSIYFCSSETGYSIGNNYNGNFVFLKTTNGGNNWISQYAATNTFKNPMALFFSDVLTGYAAGGDVWLEHPGCIFKTTNGGINWITIYLQDTTVFRTIYFPSPNTGFIAGSYGYLSKTTNSGNNWFHLNSGTSNELTSIYFIDNNTGFIAGSNGTILKTTDSGNSWVNQFSNTALSLRSIHFENFNVGFSCGSNSVGDSAVILKTTNSGYNWIVILEETTHLNYHFKSIFFTGINVGYISATRRILKTTNSGNNWFYLDLPLPNFIAPSFGNSISFLDSNTGYICGGSYGPLNAIILKTTNGGISAIPSAPGFLQGYYYSNPRRVKLNWLDRSYIESGFKIERKIFSDSIWQTIDSVASNVEMYDDYLLAPGYNIYSYRIYAYNENGKSEYSNTISVTLTNINFNAGQLVKEYSIIQNYPNPFNQSTMFNVKCSMAGIVKVIVYDISGKEVVTLVNKYLQPGTYEVRFDAKDLPSGIYFCRMQAGKFTETKKLIILK